MPSPDPYITRSEFQWSLGMLITAIVGVLVAVISRVYKMPTRMEVDKKVAETMVHINDQMIRMNSDERESFRLIRESISDIKDSVKRLEAGYFGRSYKTPGDK